MSVFAPKGGVGKTTIAFNLAVALGQLDQRTVLIDGSLQFGDLRSLLKVPVDAPSILDLPTDRIAESDLSRRPVARPVGHRHPPRAAAHRDGRDADAARRGEGPVAPASRLRGDRHRHVEPAQRHQPGLPRCERRRSSRSSPTTRRPSTTRWPWPTRSGRSAIPASKVRYLVNRADSPGGIDPIDLERALGRVPEHRVVSDGMLVVQSNNEGVPFVLASPEAPDQQGRHARRDRDPQRRPDRRRGRAVLSPRWRIRDRSGSSTPGSAA